MVIPNREEIRRLYGLQPLRLEHMPLFNEAFALVDERLSDYTFANTYIWADALGLSWAQIEGFLCVFANTGGDLTMLLPPLGQGDLGRCLKRCFEVMDDFNDRHAHRSHSRIEYVSDWMLSRFSDLGFVSAPMGGDYIYDMSRMIDLAGGQLKSKRQAKTKFARLYDVRTEPLGDHHIAVCKSVLRTWHAQGDAKDADDATEANNLHRYAMQLRTFDIVATEQALDNYATLNLTGMVLWANDEVAGFALGEPLTENQASIVIEKTDRQFAGAAQYIFSEFCRLHWADFAECNVGDDWGLPTLRWTKQSYDPVRLLGKHAVTAVATPLLGWMPEVDLPLQNPPAHLAASSPPPPADLPEYTVAAANAADLAALIALEQRVFVPGEAFTAKQLRYLLRSPRALVKVAKANGSVVGWIIALLRHHKRYDTARLYSLAVDPDHRGRGLGKLLTVDMLAEIERLGINRCFLEVREENETAQRLYEGLGFMYVASLPDYYGPGQHGRKMLRVTPGTAAKDTTPSIPEPVVWL